MADWNPQPHNDLPQNSQKIKLCIVLWETFVLPGSDCDYTMRKSGPYSFGGTIKTTRMKLKTGRLQIEKSKILRNTLICMVFHINSPSKTSIYGQILMDVKDIRKISDSAFTIEETQNSSKDSTEKEKIVKWARRLAISEKRFCSISRARGKERTVWEGVGDRREREERWGGQETANTVMGEDVHGDRDEAVWTLSNFMPGLDTEQEIASHQHPQWSGVRIACSCCSLPATVLCLCHSAAKKR